MPFFSVNQRVAEEWDLISNDAKFLIKRMLTYDPKLRITAKEALADKWFQKFADKNDKSGVSNNYLVNLSKFQV
jgi:calcium-dependent protein kinase